MEQYLQTKFYPPTTWKIQALGWCRALISSMATRWIQFFFQFLIFDISNPKVGASKWEEDDTMMLLPMLFSWHLIANLLIQVFVFFCISTSTTENKCWCWAHECQDADDLDSRVVGFCSHEWRVLGESKMMIIQGDQDRRSDHSWCLFQVTPGGNVRLWRRVGSSKPAFHQKWVPAQSLLLINIKKQPQNISWDLLHAVPWCSAAESQSALQYIAIY